jgi:hypothetical protein
MARGERRLERGSVPGAGGGGRRVRVGVGVRLGPEWITAAAGKGGSSAIAADSKRGQTPAPEHAHADEGMARGGRRGFGQSPALAE